MGVIYQGGEGGMGVPQEVGEVAFYSAGLKLLKANKNAPETRPWSGKGPDSQGGGGGVACPCLQSRGRLD